MRLTIDLSEIQDIVTDDDIQEFLIDAMDDTVTEIYTDLTAPSPVGTPVLSNAARNSIQIDRSDPLHPEVYSTSPYMNRLENGWSKKTPAGYWQRAIDKATR